jgi:hypothetical protein
MIRATKIFIFCFASLILTGCSPDPPANVEITDISWSGDPNPLCCDKDGKVKAKIRFKVKSPPEQTITLKVTLWDNDTWLNGDDLLAEDTTVPLLRAQTGKISIVDRNAEFEVRCTELPECQLEGDLGSSGEKVAELYIYVQWADNNSEIKGWYIDEAAYTCKACEETEEEGESEEGQSETGQSQTAD